MADARPTAGQAKRRTRCAAIILAAWLSVQVHAGAATAAQPGFQTPDDAIAALVTALQTHDDKATGTILGPGSEPLIHSGDPVLDQQQAQRFLDAYTARHALAADGPNRQILHVGDDDWPLPIPLVQRDGLWRFDSHAGAREIIDRRIGRDELAAIGVAVAYVDAQHAYFDLFKAATGTGAFAQHLASTPGNFDGLYWPPAAGIPESPFGPLVATAVEEGYPGDIQAGRQIAYKGYYYRILTAQGPDAVGGAKTYLRNGKMTDGFALLAWPAIYGTSGVMSFIVNQDGVVYQRDLGPDTATRAAAIRAFNPSLDWARIDISPPPPGQPTTK